MPSWAVCMSQHVQLPAHVLACLSTPLQGHERSLASWAVVGTGRLGRCRRSWPALGTPQDGCRKQAHAWAGHPAGLPLRPAVGQPMRGSPDPTWSLQQKKRNQLLHAQQALVHLRSAKHNHQAMPAACTHSWGGPRGWVHAVPRCPRHVMPAKCHATSTHCHTHTSLRGACASSRDSYNKALGVRPAPTQTACGRKRC